jgi:outer membrane biogenesis lipoprotein LolB
MRVPIILMVAALALSGCSPNQEVNASSQTATQVWAGHYEDINPYNPISYAQNNTGRGGGR